MSTTVHSERVWKLEFLKYFQRFLGDTWFLCKCSEKDPVPERWRRFRDSAKVRFCCESCSNGWTSMKGRIVFWFYLDYRTRVGYCLFKLYGQKCKKCNKDCVFEPPMWYPEEINKVIVNVYNRIGEVYYNFTKTTLLVDRRDGRPRLQHNRELCQACQTGECWNGPGDIINAEGHHMSSRAAIQGTSDIASPSTTSEAPEDENSTSAVAIIASAAETSSDMTSQKDDSLSSSNILSPESLKHHLDSTNSSSSDANATTLTTQDHDSESGPKHFMVSSIQDFANSSVEVSNRMIAESDDNSVDSFAQLEIKPNIPKDLSIPTATTGFNFFPQAPPQHPHMMPPPNLGFLMSPPAQNMVYPPTHTQAMSPPSIIKNNPLIYNYPHMRPLPGSKPVSTPIDLSPTWAHFNLYHALNRMYIS
ncbi:uncharacterized protein LOC142358673 isoform X2 [Convolutriloba macropyga]|uniref:uncharacterized protein LOC142358673 isoform X2 n=1 Tax=Convolutriloba macropyga TaxID=536237 RepID=UPI003F51DC78